MDYSNWKEKVEALTDEIIKFAQYIKNFENDLLPGENLGQDNELIIISLYRYLDDLSSKIISLKGTNCLPIKMTNQIEDRAWVVLNDDLKEANNIIEIMALMKKKGHKVKIDNILAVNSEDILKVKKLIQETNHFKSFHKSQEKSFTKK
mgnify:CR=1 FL=1